MSPALVNQKQAAAYLGMSVPTFREKVRHELRSVSVHRRRLFPVADLDRWVEANAHAL